MKNKIIKISNSQNANEHIKQKGPKYEMDDNKRSQLNI